MQLGTDKNERSNCNLKLFIEYTDGAAVMSSLDDGSIESLQESMRLSIKSEIATSEKNAQIVSNNAILNELTFTHVDQKVEKIDYNFFENAENNEDQNESGIQSNQVDQILERNPQNFANVRTNEQNILRLYNQIFKLDAMDVVLYMPSNHFSQ